MTEREAQAPLQARSWPILSGSVPFPAEGYVGRPETGQGPWQALHPGLTVVLGPDANRASPAGRLGGTGKTQLAAAFARKLWQAGGLDLLVWVSAGSRDSIVASYARTLADIRVAAPPGDPEAAAARLVTWLAATGRPWLVVLDGVAEPADLDGLWPHGPSGQAVVTTRLAGLSFSPASAGPAGGNASRPGPQQLAIPVPAFSQREAMTYLSARLNDDPYQAAGSLDLAIALGCLPVGLALAVAYLLDSGLDCRLCRMTCEQYQEQRGGGFAGDPLAPLWILAVERVRQNALAELAWPALKLAAVLGPARIPGSVLISSGACAYVTGRPTVTGDDRVSVQRAFGNLERLGLVAIDPDSETRTVWMSAALQSSVRRAMTPAELRQAVQAAAGAVCESWPKDSAKADLEQALRDCATSIRRCDETALWHPRCHPLLARAGRSLDDARMTQTALGYWRDLARRAVENFGGGAPLTFQLRERHAAAAMAAGRPDEAKARYEELAADVDKLAGPAHPQAIAARASLAVALRATGRLSDAISLGTRAVADSDLVYGPAHTQTTQILRELGGAYCDAGRYHEAVGVLQRCLTLRERSEGLMQPQTVSARQQLAEAYRRAGRPQEAVRLYQQTLEQVERAVGAAHPDAVAARSHLAMAYYQAGQIDDAAAAFERALAEAKRVPGAGPADTIATRANLAAVYCLNGRLEEAISLHQSELADLERIRGPAHPDTLHARWNLAAACHKAKRLPEAVKLGETSLADCERVLGPGHRETLTVRANLAHAYHARGLLKRASAHFDRALRDCEQSLRPDDPLTDAVRTLRKRYLAGRQGAAPILAPPVVLPRRYRARTRASAMPAARVTRHPAWPGRGTPPGWGSRGRRSRRSAAGRCPGWPAPGTRTRAARPAGGPSA
jgi:tetratricopeptide (TPR) repeat protein